MVDEIVARPFTTMGPGHGEAILTVYVNGQAGDLPTPVPFNATEEDIKTWASEAIRNGSVRGIDPQPVDFRDYVVDPIPAHDDLPNRIALRPKTPFGLGALRRDRPWTMTRHLS